MDPNKRNLVYFEEATMRELYESMDSWQETHAKRLLSVSIQPDGGRYCCIALTNPTEVMLVNGRGVPIATYTAHHNDRVVSLCTTHTTPVRP